MRILSFNFTTKLAFSEPVVEHDFLLRCMPRSSARQTVLACDVSVFPAAALSRQEDGFGNVTLAGRIAGPHDEFEFLSTGEVLVDEEGRGEGLTPWKDGPQAPVFARPSELTAPGENVRRLVAEALGEDALSDGAAGLAGRGASALELARRLSEAVGARMSYARGATDVTTTAEEALAAGAGVCQDYTHALLSACRLAGVPARYVSGLLLGEGASHSWADVLCEDGWHGIDPTNGQDVGDGYVVLGYGRDFRDCPVERGVFKGSAEQSQSVSVRVADESGRPA